MSPEFRTWKRWASRELRESDNDAAKRLARQMRGWPDFALRVPFKTASFNDFLLQAHRRVEMASNRSERQTASDSLAILLTLADPLKGAGLDLDKELSAKGRQRLTNGKGQTSLAVAATPQPLAEQSVSQPLPDKIVKNPRLGTLQREDLERRIIEIRAGSGTDWQNARQLNVTKKVYRQLVDRLVEQGRLAKKKSGIHLPQRDELVEEVVRLRREGKGNKEITELLGIEYKQLNYYAVLGRKKGIIPKSAQADSGAKTIQSEVRRLRLERFGNSQIAEKLVISQRRVGQITRRLIKSGEIKPLK